MGLDFIDFFLTFLNLSEDEAFKSFSSIIDSIYLNKITKIYFEIDPPLL